MPAEIPTTEVDDDPVRTATYMRGLRNGMFEAAKICDGYADRIAETAPKSPFILAHRYDAMAIREAMKELGYE